MGFSISWIKLKAIVQSRVLVYKNRKKEYVLERAEICRTCPFNSINKEKDKTIKGRFLRMVNLYKPYCTACGCGIKYKISVPFSVCGLDEIGKEPKWKEYEVSN